MYRQPHAIVIFRGNAGRVYRWTAKRECAVFGEWHRKYQDFGWVEERLNRNDITWRTTTREELDRLIAKYDEQHRRETAPKKRGWR